MDTCCPKCKKYNMVDMNGNRFCTFCKHNEPKHTIFVSALTETKTDCINEQSIKIPVEVETDVTIKSYTEEEWKNRK